jgi:hypothetical protein
MEHRSAAWIFFSFCLTLGLLGCTEEETGCWRELYAPGDADEISMVWGTSSSDVFAIGTGHRPSGVLHFDGDEWEEVPLSGVEYEYYRGVWGIPGRYFFIKHIPSADECIIVEYDGQDWSKTHSGVSGNLTDIWGSSENDVYVVGYRDLDTDSPVDASSIILHFDGERWSEVDNNFSISLRSIWGSSSTDVFAVGDGSILHYDGNSWSVVEEDLPRPLKTVWGASADSVYVSGGAIMHYDGVKWTEVVAHGSYDMWVSPESEVFLVGGGYPAIYSDGTDWINRCGIPYHSEERVYLYFTSIWGTSREDVFAVGSKQYWGSFSEGIILRSNFKDELNCFCE